MRALWLALLAGSLLTAAEPAAVPPYQRLTYPPLKEVKLPHIDSVTLPNGMRVYLLENHELPLISGFALVRTGNLFDPPDKVGLAGMTGQMLRSGGTKSKTGDQLDEELEAIAAGVESSIGEGYGSVSFNALKANAGQVLEIFHDVLVRPEFRKEKLDLAKTQEKGGIARRDDDASGIPGRELSALIYGRNNSYGWRTEIATIDRIQRSDLVAFYQRYFFPANVILAVEGDFNSQEMRRQLEALFADWQVKQPPVPEFPKVTPQQNAGVYFLPRNDVTQTFFAIGELGGTFAEKDYPALQVLGDILGGSFTSRLFRRVRTQLGYAYDINASWSAEFDHPGMFVIGGSTKSQSTVETLRAIRQEIDRIRTTEVTDAELATAKQTTLNSFVFNFDSANKTLNRLIIYQYYGYPPDFLTRYQEAIKNVTKADVLRVAKERLRPDALTYVAAGNPDEFGKPLKDFGLPVHPLYETSAAPPTSTPASPDAALKLLQKMQQTMGGKEKIAAVKDASYTSETEMKSAAGAFKARQLVRWTRSGAYRQDQDLPFGKVIVFSDGQTGWMSGPQGMMALPPPVAKQMSYERFRYLLSLVLSDGDKDRKLSLKDANTVEISGPGGIAAQLEIDPETGLPGKNIYPSSALGGGAGMVEEKYENWRKTEGLMLPYQIAIRQNGQPVGLSQISTWKLDTGLTAEELRKKP